MRCMTIRRVAVTVYLSTDVLRALREAHHTHCEGECATPGEMLAHVADNLAQGLTHPNSWAGETCKANGIERKAGRWRADPDRDGVFRPRGWRRRRRREDA